MYYARVGPSDSEIIDMTPISGAKMALEKELETYKTKLPELKAHEGKYVLIQARTSWTCLRRTTMLLKKDINDLV